MAGRALFTKPPKQLQSRSCPAPGAPATPGLSMPLGFQGAVRPPQPAGTPKPLERLGGSSERPRPTEGVAGRHAQGAQGTEVPGGRGDPEGLRAGVKPAAPCPEHGTPWTSQRQADPGQQRSSAGHTEPPLRARDGLPLPWMPGQWPQATHAYSSLNFHSRKFNKTVRPFPFPATRATFYVLNCRI